MARRLDQVGNVDTTGRGAGDWKDVQTAAAEDVFSLPRVKRVPDGPVTEPPPDRLSVEQQREAVLNQPDPNSPLDEPDAAVEGFAVASTVPGQVAQTGSVDTTEQGTPYVGNTMAAAVAPAQEAAAELRLIEQEEAVVLVHPRVGEAVLDGRPRVALEGVQEVPRRAVEPDGRHARRPAHPQTRRKY